MIWLSANMNKEPSVKVKPEKSRNKLRGLKSENEGSTTRKQREQENEGIYKSGSNI